MQALTSSLKIKVRKGVKKLLLLILVLSHVSLTNAGICNTYGGDKRGGHAWWSYQICDDVSEKPLSPILATQIGKSERHNKAFEIYVTPNTIVIKESRPGLTPPNVVDAKVIIDGGVPYPTRVFNYGFYPVVRSPVREVHILKNDYHKFLEGLKKAKDLKVEWFQDEEPRTDIISFGLEDVKESLKHLELMINKGS